MADTNTLNEAISQLAGDEYTLYAATLDLTDATAVNHATGLDSVKLLMVGVNTNPSGAGTAVGAVMASINSGDDGSIDIEATGATGTTTVNILALGTFK